MSILSKDLGLDEDVDQDSSEDNNEDEDDGVVSEGMAKIQVATPLPHGITMQEARHLAAYTCLHMTNPSKAAEIAASYPHLKDAKFQSYSVQICGDKWKIVEKEKSEGTETEKSHESTLGTPSKDIPKEPTRRSSGMKNGMNVNVKMFPQKPTEVKELPEPKELLDAEGEDQEDDDLEAAKRLSMEGMHQSEDKVSHDQQMKASEL